MKKVTKKLALLLCLVMLATVLVACGDKKDGDSNSGSGDSGKTDAITGTWKQTSEQDGNWIWTFSDGSKAKLVGETTGFESEGTYKLDEANKKVHVSLEKWDNEKDYDYTLDGNNLTLKETYSTFNLVKQ